MAATYLTTLLFMGAYMYVGGWCCAGCGAVRCDAALGVGLGRSTAHGVLQRLQNPTGSPIKRREDGLTMMKRSRAHGKRSRLQVARS